MGRQRSYPPPLSRGPEDAPAAFPRAFTNPGNTPLGLAGLDRRAGLAPLRKTTGASSSTNAPRSAFKAETGPAIPP
jgi:hypothetical protein